MADFTLHDLEAIISDRASASPDESWTARLIAAGREKAVKKLGEEAVETVIAALGNDRDALIAESADLVYHLMVVCRLHGVTLEEILSELDRRTAESGLAEKASRNA